MLRWLAWFWPLANQVLTKHPIRLLGDKCELDKHHPPHFFHTASRSSPPYAPPHASFCSSLIPILFPPTSPILGFFPRLPRSSRMTPRRICSNLLQRYSSL